jgi:hypothetical protein
MQKPPVTATMLAKLKAAAKDIQRAKKISRSAALEEAARDAGFANYHQVVSGVDHDPVKITIAAFRRCIKGGGSESLVDKAQHAWLGVATSNDPQAIGRLELLCANDIELAALYYHTVSTYLIGAPSYEPDIGWVKVSGFVFELQNATSFSPLIELSDQQCEQLAADLRQVRTLPGGVFPGNIRVSKFGLVLFEQAMDMMVDSNLLGMEASIASSWRPKKTNWPTVPASDNLFVYVMVLMELPWRDDVSTWDEFNENFAGEVERPDVRAPLQLRLPSLSAEPATYSCWAWDATHSLCQTIFGDGFDQLEETVISELNSVSRTNPLIEIFVSPKTKMSGLQIYSVACRVSDDDQLIREMGLFDTCSPGFAIGWMHHVLEVYVGHRAEIRASTTAQPRRLPNDQGFDKQCV